MVLFLGLGVEEEVLDNGSGKIDDEGSSAAGGGAAMMRYATARSSILVAMGP